MFSFLNSQEQETPDNTLAPTNSAINRITLSYIVVLVLIGLLSLFSYAALNDATVNQERTAVLINIAGRQRMLSQKIALLSLQIVHTPPGSTREALRAQLLDYAAEMGTDHRRLVDENADTNLAGRSFSPEIRALYFDPPSSLDIQVADYLSSAQALAQVDNPLPDDSHLSYIISNAPTLLEKLDVVVGRYTAESIADTDALERQERWTFISILALLVVVGLFIFLPMEQRIRREQHRFVNEIEERKKAEGKLRESEGFVQRILETAPDPIYVYDVIGQRDIFINDKLLQMLGYAPEQLQTNMTGLVKLIHLDDLQIMRQRSREYFKNGAIGILENEYRLKDAQGEWRWFYSRDILFSRKPDGTPWQMLGTAREITYRKQIEMAHEQMAAIIRSSNDAIIGKTLDGVITSWNAGAEQLYGYTAEEVIGKSMSLLIPPDEFDELPYILKTLQHGDRIENYETIRIHKNGQRLDVSLTISPIQDSTDKIIGASTISRDITERKQAEAALQRSEMLYRTLASHLPDMAIIIYDRDLRYILTEGPFLEKTGYSKEKIEGKLISEVLSSDALEAVRPYLENGLKGETTQFERQSGNITYLGRIVPVIDSREGITSVMFVIQDITQLKQAEKILSESEERFRTLITHSPVGIFRTDADGQYTFVNHQWREMTGFSEKDALGSGWIQALHPDDRELVIGFWQITVEEKREFNLEYRYRRSDGDVVWVLANAVVLTNDDGEMIGYLGTITNLTERKKMEEELSEKEARFRQFADNINHVFWMVTPDFGEVLYVSPAYADVWGRSCESVLDNPLSFLENAHPEDRKRLVSEYHQKIRLGNYHSEYRLIRPDGSIRWIRSHIFPIKNEEGKLYRIAGISEDITDRKWAEQQAMQLRVEKERVHMLSDFITNTSHELRTPLSTINTSVYLAQKQTDMTKQKRYFEMIETRVWQLNRLIDQLHMMTKLDNETVLETSSIHVNQIIESIKLNLDAQAAVKHIQITLDLLPQLLPVQAHYDYIHHAIENLLENAILYTPDNGSITMRTFQRDDTITIEIHDSGIGIKSENINRIFDRFYKVNEARTGNSSGAGLGLTMVKKIVELHHGEVDVESTPNNGSIFRLYLPIRQPASQQLEPLL